MIPADVDPSLRAEPLLETLADGFSPPPRAEDAPRPPQGTPMPAEPGPGDKSPF